MRVRASFDKQVFPAALQPETPIVIRNRDAPGIVGGTCRFGAVAGHCFNPGGADAVRIGNGIDGKLLCHDGVPVGDVHARLRKAGIREFGLGAGVSCRVAEDGDAEERGNHGLEVGAGCRVLPQSSGQVRAVARVVG